jgi:hypothetical protein
MENESPKRIYEGLPTPTLQSEQQRIQATIASLLSKHEIIVSVIVERATINADTPDPSPAL